MKLLIKFPTRGRPRRFIETFSVYVRMMEDADTRVLITCDNDDGSMTGPDITSQIKKIHKNSEVKFGNNPNKVAAINSDIEGEDFDILMLASDDMMPVTKGFDKIIKQEMEKHYPDTDGVLWFDDGYQGPDLNTLPIMGRKYYNRFGYIYHPSYISLWCDQEFTSVADTLKKQTYIDKMIIQHQHPVVPGFTHLNDEIYAANGYYNEVDMENFWLRQTSNFELEAV